MTVWKAEAHRRHEQRHHAPGCGRPQASIAVGHVVGVAKEASVVALKVLDCRGTGTVSNVVAGAPTLRRSLELSITCLAALSGEHCSLR